VLTDKTLTLRQEHDQPEQRCERAAVPRRLSYVVPGHRDYLV